MKLIALSVEEMGIVVVWCLGHGCRGAAGARRYEKDEPHPSHTQDLEHVRAAGCRLLGLWW